MTLPTEEFISSLDWRYATKKFDPTKKLTAEQLNLVTEALRKAPSSLGLQLWKFFVITDLALKQRLQAASYNQAKVTDCSHFIVLCSKKTLTSEDGAKLIELAATERKLSSDAYTQFKQTITQYVANYSGMPQSAQTAWLTHQVYIALGFLLSYCAVAGIDTCPMEGFEPAKYDEYLGLTGTDYASVVACAVGFRAKDDSYAALKKVRYSRSDVVVDL